MEGKVNYALLVECPLQSLNALFMFTLQLRNSLNVRKLCSQDKLSFFFTELEKQDT